jgi:NifU-like protein
MSFIDLYELYPFTLKEKILHPKFVGQIDAQQAKAKSLFLAKEECGHIDCSFLRLYLLVDEEDGIICDAKYQLIGESFLIGLMESVCGLILRKNYMQAQRISKELIIKELKIKEEALIFAKGYLINLVLDLIYKITEQCTHIRLKELSSPTPQVSGSKMQIEAFFTLPVEEKISIIEQVIQEDVRPYIELDEGGIEVLGLEKNKVMIRYQGACTSCMSAIGGTLSYIQEIIQSKVHPDLIVEPNLSNFEINLI